MSSLRLTAAAISADIISTETIRRVLGPSVVNMWASGATAGDQLGLSLDRTEILPVGDINIEIAVDVVDVARDQCVWNTVVGRGDLRVPVGTVTAEIQGWLSVEPIL